MRVPRQIRGDTGLLMFRFLFGQCRLKKGGFLAIFVHVTYITVLALYAVVKFPWNYIYTNSNKFDKTAAVVWCRYMKIYHNISCIHRHLVYCCISSPHSQDLTGPSRDKMEHYIICHFV